MGDILPHYCNLMAHLKDLKQKEITYKKKQITRNKLKTEIHKLEARKAPQNQGSQELI